MSTKGFNAMRQKTSVKAPSWGLDSIPFNSVDSQQVIHREDLFYLVVAASFIEIASDLYTANLAEYFQEDVEIVEWLEKHWQHEEVRHGYSLRDYAKHVWPDFNWDAAYQSFFDEYAPLCTVEEFEPSQALEMAARCVIETGTATFYTALSGQSPEPILAGIAANIRAEEVGHYKYFYRYFRQYRQQEGTARRQVFGAIWRRIVEARNSDAEIALWHVFAHRNSLPVEAEKPQEFHDLCRQIGKQVKQHYPVDLAAKMVLRPLDLPRSINRVIEGPVASAATWLLR